MSKNSTIAILLLVIAYLIAYKGDPNDKPVYGESGFPKNCRAYVQATIDGYRAKDYSAEGAFEGLQRNCGANGQIWGIK